MLIKKFKATNKIYFTNFWNIFKSQIKIYQTKRINRENNFRKNKNLKLMSLKYINKLKSKTKIFYYD